jgi:hypothetical protein
MKKTSRPPETDDARASDSPDADKRREKLADEAGKLFVSRIRRG